MTIEYPDSDGKRMADGTKQARWMTLLFGNLCSLFREAADVFIAIDLLWYAVRGHPESRQGPDVFVVFGRPKGDRGSYRQWEEGGVPVTVVFEILSPSSTVQEMTDKFAFYEEHGVEEYYLYDPERNRLVVYLRRGEVLARIRRVDGFVSPRLGIRFGLSGPEMVVFYPDGRRFRTFEEVDAERVSIEQKIRDAEQRIKNAEQRTASAEQQIQDIQWRAARRAELMRRVLQQQAAAEELQELQQLLQQQPPSVQ
jgi:Uma2 family endonuclease